MSQNQISGLLGSVLIFAGLFSPIFSSPVTGNVTYFQYDRTEALLLLGVAALALTFALAGRTQPQMFLGMAALALFAFALIKFQLFTSGTDARWLKKFSESPFEGINRLVQQTFALEWGWALLLVGAVLLLASGRIRGYSE